MANGFPFATQPLLEAGTRRRRPRLLNGYGQNFKEAAYSSSDEPGWEGRYIGHVYFTYISLWMGFVILPTLDLPMPQVTVPVIAVADRRAPHPAAT